MFTIDCDVRAAEADVVTIDALARLQLAARRLGGGIELCGASSELQELLAFMGLADALPTSRLGLEASRQAEEWEEGLGVEEERELSDPSI